MKRSIERRLLGIEYAIKEAGGTPEIFDKMWRDGGGTPAPAILARFGGSLTHLEIRDYATYRGLATARSQSRNSAKLMNAAQKVTPLEPWFNRTETLEKQMAYLFRTLDCPMDVV